MKNKAKILIICVMKIPFFITFEQVCQFFMLGQIADLMQFFHPSFVSNVYVSSVINSYGVVKAEFSARKGTLSEIENIVRVGLSTCHTWATNADKAGHYNPEHARYGIKNTELKIQIGATKKPAPRSAPSPKSEGKTSETGSASGPKGGRAPQHNSNTRAIGANGTASVPRKSLHRMIRT